jgi:hypothetical protein
VVDDENTCGAFKICKFFFSYQNSYWFLPHAKEERKRKAEGTVSEMVQLVLKPCISGCSVLTSIHLLPERNVCKLHQK